MFDALNPPDLHGYKFLNPRYPWADEVEARRLWEEVLFPAWSSKDMWQDTECFVGGYRLSEEVTMSSLVISLNRVVGWSRDGPVSAALVPEGLHVWWCGLAEFFRKH
jgi:hypothetical protein